MTDMIERVSSAIYSDLCGIGAATWEDSSRIARAAIEAMREPTDEMCNTIPHDGSRYSIYTAMIDDALARKGS